MITISVNYTCKYRLKVHTNYVFTLCGKCFNLKSGKLIRQVVKGGSIGYVICGKFKTLKYLRTQLEVIPKQDLTPF